MRKVLLVMAIMASSACGTSGQWQKPGIDQAAIDDDARRCRHDAVQETLRLFADWRPFAFDDPPFWNYRSDPSRALLRRVNDRIQMQAEQMLALTCMRNKGYTIAGA